MGQQQILFLILTVCILGIVISVGIITEQKKTVPISRTHIIEELGVIAQKAQGFYRSPSETGGGGGSFLGLTAIPNGIRKLTPNPTTPHADYFLAKTNSGSYVRLIAIGFEPGINPNLPISVAMLIWADSSAVSILN